MTQCADSDIPIVERVRIAYERVKEFPETQPNGYIRLIELRNLVPGLLDYVAKLERQIAQKALGE